MSVQINAAVGSADGQAAVNSRKFSTQTVVGCIRKVLFHVQACHKSDGGHSAYAAGTALHCPRLCSKHFQPRDPCSPCQGISDHFRQALCPGLCEGRICQECMKQESLSAFR